MILFCEECGDPLGHEEVSLGTQYCTDCRKDPEDDEYKVFKATCQIPGCLSKVDYSDEIPICDTCDAHIRKGNCPYCGEVNPNAEEQVICPTCAGLLYLDATCPKCLTPRSMGKHHDECIMCTIEKNHPKSGR